MPADDLDRLGGRLPLLAPADLDDEQAQVYEALTRLVVPEAAESGFTARLADGRFIGPFNAMLRVPRLTTGLGQWTREISRSRLDDDVRQVVILTVGVAWSAQYEIDAHVSAARAVGVPDGAIEAILQGGAPSGLSPAAQVAHRLTAALLADRAVPDQLYSSASRYPHPPALRGNPSRGAKHDRPDHRAGGRGSPRTRRSHVDLPAPAPDPGARRRCQPDRLEERVRLVALIRPDDGRLRGGGVVTALGADVEARRLVTVGEKVVVYPFPGGYASDLSVSAGDVLPKPRTLDFGQAANLLLGTTAAEMFEVAGVRSGETVVVHGASGASGISLLHQVAQLQVRVIEPTGERNADLVHSFGAEPVSYGAGLTKRLRDAAPVPVGAGQSLADVDPVGGDTERGQRVAWGGEVSRVGGNPGVADLQSTHQAQCAGCPPITGTHHRTTPTGLRRSASVATAVDHRGVPVGSSSGTVHATGVPCG